MSIIAILMALVLSMLPSTTNTAKKLQAKQTETAIVAAIVAYQTDNAKLPSLDPDQLLTQADPDADTIVGDAAAAPSADIHYHNSALFNTLRALNAAPNLADRTNPRHIVYFDDRAVNNPDFPKNGFLDVLGASGRSAEQKGCLFDPWGMEYFVVLDTSYNNLLNVSAVYHDITYPDSAPHGPAGVFALGLDRKVGSATLPPNVYQTSATNVSDDVVSWR